VADAVVLGRIEGQPRVVALLDRARQSGRIAHAWAFIGHAGSGRSTTARAFAAALLCDDGGCGACRTCRMVAAATHPDVHLIGPTPPERNPKGPRAIRIEAIRDLEREASLRPVVGRHKIFVLDDADRMTESAPEAFLKTLEEPPSHTVMILILTRARAMPATVLSRCRIVRFDERPGPASAAWPRLRELLAEAGTTGMGRVFQRLDRARPDRDEAEALVDACWLWCRDLVVAKAGVVDTQLFADPARAAEAQEHAAAWTPDELLGTLRLCRDVRDGLAVNVAPRLGVELLVSRLARVA
jgi:DNA polymerase-3 subunit delta'